MADVSLMALYWTTAGPVEIHAGREWSLYSWSERCEQAAKAGFAGIGLWHSDVSHQLETTSLKDMRRVYDDAGLRCFEAEFLADFWVPRGEPARAE
jgi:sugar phosphate isomerase/epimerase